MAAIDKIYGTQEQYNELRKWLLENQKPIKIAHDYDLVTIKGIVDCSRPQIEIYNDFVSGTIDFIFEKDIDKDNNLFTVRIEDK